jgi:hypothetical protein
VIELGSQINVEHQGNLQPGDSKQESFRQELPACGCATHVDVAGSHVAKVTQPMDEHAPPTGIRRSH